MEADASLMEVLEGIYDSRNTRGKRHPLPTLSRRVWVDGFAESSVRLMRRTLPSTARLPVAVVTARRLEFTWPLPMPWTSKPSLANSGWMPKTNEHEASLELLGVLSVKSRVISGDAMFTHRDVCAKVIEGEATTSFP